MAEKEVEINKEISKETMMLKLMADVFGAEAKIVAQVLKSIPDAQSDALIDLVMNSDSQEQLDNAVELFNDAKNQLGL